MGTPNYMPPEQAEGKNDQVGPLSDVYSLGATLYCLLTGRPPFQSANVVETLKQVVERQPAAPRFLNPAVGRDMDTICLKCLEKRPEKRYTSATALREDLQRFLEDRSILARPVGGVEKLTRWCRRNPLVAASLASIAAIFVTSFALVTWSYVRAEDARKEETKQRRQAEVKERAERWGRYRSNIAAASAALQLQNIVAARSSLEDAPEEHRNWEWQYLHSQLDGATHVLSVPGGKVRSLVLSPSGRQIAVACSKHHEVYLYDVATGKPETVLLGHSAPVTSVTYRPDGKQLATTGNDQTIRLWDPATGQQVGLLRAEVVPSDVERFPVVAYSSDGSRIASSTGGEPGSGVIGAGTSRLWDTSTHKEIAVLAKWQERDCQAVFSPSGKRVAVGSAEYLHLCDAVTGHRIAALGPHAKLVRTAAYSPDGKRIASTQVYSIVTGEKIAPAKFLDANAVQLWDGETGKLVTELRGHTSHVSSVLFSPDGSRLLSASDYPDNTARLWDAATGRLLGILAGHKNTVSTIAFSSDGKRVVTSSMDQTARLWDADSGQLLAVLSGHSGQVRHVAFSPNGTRIITDSEDATLRLWHADSGELIGVLRGHGNGFHWICQPVFTPDGSRLVSGSTDGTVRIWDMNLIERNGILSGHGSYVYDVAFHPDGEQVASAAWDGTARLWDPTTGRQTGLLKHETLMINSVAYSRNGSLLATMERERGVKLWDLAHKKTARDDWFVPPNYEEGGRACLNPAGTRLVAGSTAGPVRVWDVATGRELARLEGHEKGAIDVAFHPDGPGTPGLATTGADGTIRFWDFATHAQVAVLRGHTDIVWRVAFSTDGKLLASGSNDKTICLWDTQTHEQLKVISLGSVVYGVAFNPDGTRLAAACRDNTIRLFDVATRQQVAELRGHTDYVHAVAWSPDGTRLTSGSGDFTLRVWDSLSARDRAELARKSPPKP